MLLNEIEKTYRNEDYKKMLEFCEKTLPLLTKFVAKEKKQGGGFDVKSIPALENGCLFWAIMNQRTMLDSVKKVVESIPELQKGWGWKVRAAFEMEELSRQIQEYVREHPGVIQSQLKTILSKDANDVSIVAYYLAKFGMIERVKSGSSYQLFKGSDSPQFDAVDGTGNIYVTGGLGGSRSYTTTFCFFDTCVTYRHYPSDQVTIKYSSNGHRQWIGSYSERGDTSFAGRAIAVDPGGNVYLRGSATIDYSPVAGSATIMYSPSGRELWVKTNPTNISCQALLLDSATNLCLACGNAGTRKLDRNSNLLWTVPVYGPVLKRDASDNLYVSTGGYSGPTTKLDSGGGRIWTTAMEMKPGSKLRYPKKRASLALDSGQERWAAAPKSKASRLSRKKVKPMGHLIVGGCYPIVFI